MDSQLTNATAANSSRANTTVADAATEKSLRRRWWYLLPAVFVTYSLAYLDRANYGFGAAAGLAATLHITEKDASLLSGLFFLGYFAFQIPGATLATRYSIKRVVCAALVAWGSLAALTGVITQFWLLALDRFLLDVAESLIFPVMLLLLTRWFTRTERSRANTILIMGNAVTVLWMSAITGFLIQKFGWQKTFILEGIPSVLWGFVWVVLVRDRPMKQVGYRVRRPSCWKVDWPGSRLVSPLLERPVRRCCVAMCCCCRRNIFVGAWASTASCCGCRRLFEEGRLRRWRRPACFPRCPIARPSR